MGLGIELFTANGGFEDFTGTADDGTSEDFVSWNEQNVNDVAGDKVEATATAHSGSYALMLTKTTIPSGGIGPATQSLPGGVTVAPQQVYRVSFWTRGDGSVGTTFGIYDRSNGAYIYALSASGVTGTSYTEVIQDIFTPIGCIAIDLNIRVVSIGVAYADDVSIRKVISSGGMGLGLSLTLR